MSSVRAAVDQINYVLKISSREFERCSHLLEAIPPHLKKVLHLLLLSRERRDSVAEEFEKIEADVEYCTYVQCANVLKCCIVTKCLPKGQYRAKLKTLVGNVAKFRTLGKITNDLEFNAKYRGMNSASKKLVAIYFEEVGAI